MWGYGCVDARVSSLRGGGSNVRRDARAHFAHGKRASVLRAPSFLLSLERLEGPSLGQPVVIGARIVVRVAGHAKVLDLHGDEGGDGVGEELDIGSSNCGGSGLVRSGLLAGR